jgi:hypothetical protein
VYDRQADYKNNHHSWELRHDFGIDVRLFWYVGLQVKHPTWRLEGPEGSSVGCSVAAAYQTAY